MPSIPMDISTGGVRVCSPEPLQVGSEVDLSIELGEGQAVDVTSVVRHSRSYPAAGGDPGWRDQVVVTGARAR